jgi:arylsulfatase A-like enzyme
VRVLFIVIDGLSPRHVTDRGMPALAARAREGGWCPAGGIGVLPTLTYPNHATFVTGVPPSRHGIVANEIPTPEGSIPAWDLGPSTPTLFDVMRAADRPCAAVFGDNHLVGVTGAIGATFLWPDGAFADGVALDVLGYARDTETAARVIEAVNGDAELVVAQLNEPDTAAHIFGPDSPEALALYGRSDAHLGTIIESLRVQWDDWVAIVVSDHSQEAVTEPVPVDLHVAAAERHLDGQVTDDGAVAVVSGQMARHPRWMSAVPGVEGIRRLSDEAVLVWAQPGRWFSPVMLPVRGVHGSPRTAAQVAVVTGGHPGAKRVGAEIARRRPTAAGWAPTIAGLLGVAVPALVTR